MTRRSVATVLVRLALPGLLLFAPLSGLEAQQGPRRGMPRMEMERRVREQFSNVVRVQLGLDEAQHRRLGEVLARFQAERQQLVQREMELRRRVRGIPLASRERAALVSEAEARRILQEMAALQEAEARLMRSEQEALLEVLSPPQLVRFYGMREQLADRIRRMQQGPGGR